MMQHRTLLRPRVGTRRGEQVRQKAMRARTAVVILSITIEKAVR